MFNMPVNLIKVYTEPFKYGLGQQARVGERVFRFVQYNNGDDNISGVRGQICYPVVADDGDVSTTYEVTCDLSSTSVVSQKEFGGVIQPDVVLNGEGCWVQISGIGKVPIWATITAATWDRGDDGNAKKIMAAGWNLENISGDGIVAELVTDKHQRAFGEMLADLRNSPTLSTDRMLLTTPAGETGSYQFAVSEQITGGTSGDTAVIVECLRRRGVTYGLIVSTATSTFFHTATETITGTNTAAAAIVAKGTQIKAMNYRLRIN